MREIERIVHHGVPALVAVKWQDEDGNKASFSYYPNNYGWDPMGCLVVYLKDGPATSVRVCENDDEHSARMLAMDAIEDYLCHKADVLSMM